MMEVIRREVSRREVRIKVKHAIQKQKKERELILNTRPKTKQQKRK